MLKNDYLISVIVPVYNVQNYLRKCIESIMNQTYINLQIILVDDKSTDQSGEICDEYALKDKRIQVIHNEKNKGVIGSTKTGLSMAKGEYISRIDADDWIDDIMYEQLLKDIVSTDSDFAVTGYVFEGWEEYGRLVVADAKGLCELSDDNRYAIIRKFFYRTVADKCQIERNLTALWNKLYKAELFKKAYMQLMDFYTEYEDMISLLIIYLEAKRYVMTGSVNYHYVKRKDSCIHNVKFEKFANKYCGHTALMQVLKTYHCYDELIDDENQVYNRSMWGLVMKMLGKRYHIKSSYAWRFQDLEKLSDKKIVIYAAGDVGRDYYQQISELDHCKIVAWIDSNYKQYHYNYFAVEGIETLKEVDYDVIIVAVFAEETACSIMSDLRRSGVEERKIVWNRPKRVTKMELIENDSF